PGRVAREVVREADGGLARARPEHTVAREHDRQHRAAREVEDERDDPELAELEPRAAVASEPGDRDEEVLGEKLRAADDDEDEADPEADRSGEVRGVHTNPGLELGAREEEDRETDRDVEAADDRR